MNNEYKVSIIVPVYNVEEFLDDCLDSCLKQTIDSFEVIVVNDGSPDNSQEIIDRYVEKRPDIFKSFIIENGGLGNARNYGMSHAKGEYIAYVDSDDAIAYNFCELMYNDAKENDADVVRCDYMRFSNYNTVLKNISQGATTAKFTKFIEENGAVCYELNAELQNLIWHVAWPGIYRKAKLDEIDFKFPKGKMEDPVMKILFLEANKIVLTPKRLVFYRRREGSITDKLDLQTINIALDRWEVVLDYYYAKNVVETTGIMDAFYITACSMKGLHIFCKGHSVETLEELHKQGLFDRFYDFHLKYDPDFKYAEMTYPPRYYSLFMNQLEDIKNGDFNMLKKRERKFLIIDKPRKFVGKVLRKLKLR